MMRVRSVRLLRAVKDPRTGNDSTFFRLDHEAEGSFPSPTAPRIDIGFDEKIGFVYLKATRFHDGKWQPQGAPVGFDCSGCEVEFVDPPVFPWEHPEPQHPQSGTGHLGKR
jgi:hypothetical protein